MSIVQSVFSQLGEATDGRRRGEEKTSVIGIWSDPGLGRWVDHDVTKEANSILANERSRTGGLSPVTMGNQV